MSKRLYLIWSIQHNGWWYNNERGYVKEREKAGLYTFERASQIIKEANLDLKDVPNEAMIEFTK